MTDCGRRVPVAELLADGTPGRVFRAALLFVQNGGDDQTVKCTLTSTWNGDNIAVTNNIAKGATTGDFKLAADGKTLYVMATGLSGDVKYAGLACVASGAGVDVRVRVIPKNGDIKIVVYEALAITQLDITTLVDTGPFYFDLIYITDA